MKKQETTEKLTSTREYKYDRAMRMAAEKIKDMPKPVSMSTKVKPEQIK